MCGQVVGVGRSGQQKGCKEGSGDGFQKDVEGGVEEGCDGSGVGGEGVPG